MTIGNELNDRLDALGISFGEFCDMTMLDYSTLYDISVNKIDLEDIDEFDLEVISNVLYCTPDYFSDLSVRNNDVVY